MNKKIGKLIIELWNDEKLPIIDGLLLSNGEIYKNIFSKLMSKQIQKSERFDILEENYKEYYSSVDIFCNDTFKDYKIYGGDGSYGSDGYILVLDSDNNFVWLLFDAINPIVNISIEHDIILAENNSHIIFEIPFFSPQKIRIIEHNESH